MPSLKAWHFFCLNNINQYQVEGINKTQLGRQGKRSLLSRLRSY